jgi:hypothetical protein
MGDRATLELLRVAVELARACCLAAPWPRVRAAGDDAREPWVGAPLEAVIAWAMGEASHPLPAREWARAVDTLADHAEREGHALGEMHAGEPDYVEQACVCAGIDVVASAEACGLAFLLEDREAFATNVYRMLRSAAGIACHVYAETGRWPSTAEHPRESAFTVGYLTNDRPLRRELLAHWPGVVALQEGRLTHFEWRSPECEPAPCLACAHRSNARLRGWVPAMGHNIPPHAFEPYPNEREKEDGET